MNLKNFIAVLIAVLSMSLTTPVEANGLKSISNTLDKFESELYPFTTKGRKEAEKRRKKLKSLESKYIEAFIKYTAYSNNFELTKKSKGYQIDIEYYTKEILDLEAKEIKYGKLNSRQEKELKSLKKKLHVTHKKFATSQAGVAEKYRKKYVDILSKYGGLRGDSVALHKVAVKEAQKVYAITISN